MSIPEIVRQTKEDHDSEILAGRLFTRIAKLTGTDGSTEALITLTDHEELVTFEEDGFKYSIICFSDDKFLGIGFRTDMGIHDRALLYQKRHIGIFPNQTAYTNVSSELDYPITVASLDDLRMFGELVDNFEKAKEGEIEFKEASWQTE